ncbi:MAG: tRNA (adenosine(37)-N6)-dimethylallyltransferase MiaA [Candidatus Dojkabacteria bacterium]|nr:tRNA (adenosine(37)-N6)-dimethylallyltransferase MiaA [Candidatus Dojkabacteria bacterium]
MKDKIIAVIGPTASGKTSLAIELAKKFNGEMINTDSRQIYKYLDIGTAKGDVKKIRNSKFEIRNKYQIQNPKIETLDIYKLEGAVLHLVNVVEPDQPLSLAQYQKLAYAVIDDIFKRGKLPILVGGTGLYIDAIVKGYKMPKVKPNEKLRRQLIGLSASQLAVKLKEIDEEAYSSLNESDRANPHRLIRQIEISSSSKPRAKSSEPRSQYDVLFLTPYQSRKKLYERINKRVNLILEEGLIEEVKSVLGKGYKFDTPAMTAISYPIVKKYIDGKIGIEELKEKFAQGDRNYARRQMTWFKRYNAKKVRNVSRAIVYVKTFLRRSKLHL